MSNTDDDESYYATLGLSPDATFAQVKARYKELNNAYLKILELSRKGNARTISQHSPTNGDAHQVEQQPKADSARASSSLETRTEPIAALKEELAKGKIDKTQFDRLAKERYDYLRNKPFSELSDSEFEERLTWLDNS
jgi:hypothetical protein